MEGNSLLAAVRDAARVMHKAFGLTLFGFDCVIPQGTANLMVLDVNYFPSYKELRSEFPKLLNARFARLVEDAKAVAGPNESRFI